MKSPSKPVDLFAHVRCICAAAMVWLTCGTTNLVAQDWCPDPLDEQNEWCCPRNAELKWLWHKGSMRSPQQSQRYDIGVEGPNITEMEDRETGSFGSLRIHAPPRNSCSAYGETVGGSAWIIDPDLDKWCWDNMSGFRGVPYPYRYQMAVKGRGSLLGEYVEVRQHELFDYSDLGVVIQPGQDAVRSGGINLRVTTRKPLPAGMEEGEITLTITLYYYDHWCCLGDGELSRAYDSQIEQPLTISLSILVKQMPDSECSSCAASAPTGLGSSAVSGLPHVQAGAASWSASSRQMAPGQARLIYHDDGAIEITVPPMPSLVSSSLYSIDNGNITNRRTGEQYTFDGFGGTTSPQNKVYPLSSITPPAWASASVLQHQDPATHLPVYTYDPSTPGATIWYEYDQHSQESPAWNELTKVLVGAAASKTAAYELRHDRAGRLLRFQGADACSSCSGGTRQYAWTEEGELAEVSDGTGQVLERYEYADVDGVRKVTKVSAGSISRGNYFERSRTQYGANSITKRSVVDSTSSRVRVEEWPPERPGEVTAVYQYDDLDEGGFPTAAHVTSYTYERDGGQLTKTIEELPSGRTHVAELGTTSGATSQVTKRYMVDGGTRLLQGTYDYTQYSNGELVVPMPATSTDDRGNRTERYYDALGQLTLEVAQANLATMKISSRYMYDAQRRVTLSWKSNHDGSWTSATTQYGYGGSGNLTRSVEAASTSLAAVTLYEYDLHGRQTLTVDPKGNGLGRTFDVSGKLLSDYVYANGTSGPVISQTWYEYDAEGRVATQWAANATGPFSRITTAPTAPGWSATAYAYDFLGRKIAVTEDAGPTGLNLVTRYDYNHQDEVVRTITPGGVYTELVRNGRGLQVGQIVGYLGCDAQERQVTTYEYDADGNVTSTTSPLQVVTRYEYDGFGRRTKVIAE